MAKELPVIVPQHIAVIPDGNRRYSQRIFMDSISGYEQSGQSLERLLAWSLGSVKELSIFAWSCENWSRPKEQVDGAMVQFHKALDQWLSDDQEDIAYVFISTRPDKLSSTLRVKMHQLQLQTSENSKLNFRRCLNNDNPLLTTFYCLK